MDIVKGFRRMQRQVASFSLAALIASLFAVGVAQAQTFPDVAPSDWFYPYVEDLVTQGVVNGSMPSYRPNDNVNRAEMAKLVVEAFEIDMIDPSTATFTDVAKGQWYFTYVESVAAAGIVGGYKNNQGELTGFYGPADAVTRDQAAKMIVLGAPLTTNTSCGPSFGDVALTDWSYSYVETLYAWSVVDGYSDGTFGPGRSINRAEISKLVSNALNPVMRPCGGFNVEDASALSSTTVEVCFNADYDETSAMMEENYSILDQDADELAVTGVDSSSDPMCVVLTTASQTAGNSYDLMVEGVSSSSDMELGIGDASFTGFSAVGSGGDLVCTAGTQPGDSTVPKGATGVDFTVVNCSADEDPVVLSSLTFKREGVGNEQDFANVYLYDGDGNRLTTGRSINSESQEVTFGGLNVAIGSNETESLVVVGDISTTAGAANEHTFVLVDKDDVESNASSVGGTYPVEGSLMRISGSTAGTITITKNGSLDELTIGETGRIAQFELQAGGTESMELQRIALYVRGTCDASDVTDLTLFNNAGEELATADEVGAKDLATFVLDNPFVIDQGDSEIFYVTAKVLCRDSETVRTYLDETTDLLAVGNQFGTGVAVTNTYNGTGVLYSEVTVRGSDFTVAFSGMPSSGDIAIGQDDVSCLDISITNGSGQSVEARDWEIVVSIINANATANDAQGLYDAAGSDANYSLFKLARVNEDGSIGGTLLGPSELATTETAANDDSQTIVLDGNYTFSPGETLDAAVVFDVETTANDADQIRCTLSDLTGVADSVRDSNGDALGADSITPSAAIVGNVFTLDASGLTIELASTPSSRNYVSGTQNAALGGFSLRSGSSLANTIKSLTFQGYIDANVDNNFDNDADNAYGSDGGVALKDVVNTVGLYDGNTLVSELKNINSTDGKVIFNNLSITVPQSQTKTLTIKGKISNSSPFGGDNDRVKFAVTAATDVVAIDGNGRNLATASITVAAAANGAEAAGSVQMTVTAGGTGTVADTTSLTASVLTGANALEVAKVRFSSTDESPVLKDLQFGILNNSASAISRIYLAQFTGGVCGSPIGSASGYTSTTAGVFNITDVGITIPNESTITLCVLADVNQVNQSSTPTSGSNVGVVLLNVTEVTGGSGTNISQSYAATATAEELDSDLTAVSGTVVTNNDVVFFTGDVIVIDQEMMFVVADAGANLTVLRGFANTTAVVHNVDDADGGDNGTKVIGLSTIAVGADADDSNGTGDLDGAVIAGDTNIVVTSAGFQVGDVVSMLNTAGGAVEYMLVTAIPDAANLTVQRALFGSTALANDNSSDATDDLGRFPIHGDLFRLRKSAPAVTLNPSNSTYYPQSFIGGGETTILSFNVAATGQSEVIFGTDNHIAVTITGQQEGGAIDEDISCSLRAKPASSGTWTTYSTNATVQAGVEAFEFLDATPLSFQDTSYTFAIVCDTVTGWTLTPGDRISASLASAAGTIEWNDTTADVLLDGALVIPVALTGPTLTANI